MQSSQLPSRAGIGFKPQHFADIVASASPSASSRCMRKLHGRGRPAHAQLSRLRRIMPSPSMASACPSAPCSRSMRRIWSACVSCAIAMSRRASPNIWPGRAMTASISTTCCPALYGRDAQPRGGACEPRANAPQAADAAGESGHLSHTFAESTLAETDFLAEVARRTGCGLLLDVNNVFVAATKPQYGPRRLSRPFSSRGGPRNPSERPRADHGRDRRAPAHRFTRLAGYRPCLGALCAGDRTHRPGRDADRVGQ